MMKRQFPRPYLRDVRAAQMHERHGQQKQAIVPTSRDVIARR